MNEQQRAVISSKPLEVFNTAVLFLVFNRPDTTAQVFEAIRKAQPSRLYVAADGAREGREGEKENVEAVRRIVTNVDWPCEVKTLFRDTNLGCKYAVSSGITWFFEHEEQGIILEDDCLPTQSFFWFCEECLNKYENDLRIWQVSGTTLLCDNFSPINSSYFFSNYGSIWGWATWRTRWIKYDVELDEPLNSKLFSYVLNSLDEKGERKIRMAQFNKILNGFDTWDYQWFYTRLSNSGLSIVPSVNLVSNIGFGDDATHTLSSRKDDTLLYYDMEFPLQHPPCIVRAKERDLEYVKRYVIPPCYKKIKSLLFKLFAIRIFLAFLPDRKQS